MVEHDFTREFVMNFITRKLTDPTFRGGLHLPANTLQHYAIETNGTLLNRVLKERFSIDMSGMKFPRNHRFFETFDKKLQQLFAGGIMDYYASQWLNNLKHDRFKHLYIDEPEVLTLKHLEAGFRIWLVSIGIAICAFIVELLVKWIPIWRDSLVVKYVIASYYMQRDL